MFWADYFIDQIVKSGKYKPYWVDDMKTPSGKIHVGALRGVVIHDLLYKVLKERGKSVTYTYCINDMDPMDGFPVYLDRDKFYKYMGCPLFKIPSPQQGFASFSRYYAQEFIDVFNSIGCHPKIIWTSDLYKTGKFDKLIKIFLDNTQKIRKIIKEQYKNFKEENYFPYQPICPKCGKISTTKIYKWDGEYVYFKCKKDAVAYTQGCGFEGKVKPEKLNGKLPWRIEWVAHWKTLGVTIEWSGKDHMTQGGSHEFASRISEEILAYPTPQAQSYEHFLIGGKKMSSSKGLGASAKDMAQILPPQLLRFLMVKIHFKKAINFDPQGEIIPSLFDEYDEYCHDYYKNGVKTEHGRIWQLSQIEAIAKNQPYLPRFRDVANYLQSPSVNIEQKFSELKGKKLTESEKKTLSQRIKYARIWLDRYAPEKLKFSVVEEEFQPDQEQKRYLKAVVDLVEAKEWEAEKLQFELYGLAKKQNFPPKKAFGTIYMALIGKTYGPKAAWFILENKDKVLKRLKEVVK
jgi:lysyl-tRNA synthetase class 1